MALLRIQHQFNHKSGLAKDVVVNTFHVLGPDPTAPGVLTGGPALVAAVVNFYDAIPAGAAVRLSSWIHTNAMALQRHTIKIYDMSDPTPRAPILTATPDNVTGIANTTAGLPHEVAMCLSYSAAQLSGINQKRRRGRIYIGPLNTSALMEVAATGVVRPKVELRDIMLLAARDLRAAFDDAGYDWVIFSPTTHGSNEPVTGEDALAPIATITVDDSFDTQRRRGEARTQVQSLTL